MTIASARAVLAAPDRVEGPEKVTGAARYAYEYAHDEVAYAAIVPATIAMIGGGLMFAPIMVAATGYELVKMRGLFATQDLVQFGVGFIVSFLVALIAIKAFVSFLSRWSLAPFAWYRIGVAAIFYFATRGLNL